MISSRSSKAGRFLFCSRILLRGGYTELRIIAEHAYKAGLTMAWHMFPELSVHMTASIENPSWLEIWAGTTISGSSRIIRKKE